MLALAGSSDWIFLYSGFTFVIILAFAAMAKAGIRPRTWVGTPALLAEHLYLFIDGLAVSAVGEKGKKYTPLLMGLWSFIFVGNVMSLILGNSPTADWSLNIGLSIVTMVYVQYEGIKANGLKGHLGHFSGPKLTGLLVLISALLFLIEIISEFGKIFSLSLRLFGNMHAGHLVVESFNGLIPAVPALGELILPLKLFSCIIQAYIWVVLTATYLSMVVGHEEEHAH